VTPRARAGGEDGFTLVELLVTIMIMGIVMGGLSSVVVTTMRNEQYQRELQDVIDDGRISITRIRQEVRGARRVFANSSGDRLHFWVDQDQNALDDDPAELICYVVEPIGPTGTQWQISRWTNALNPSDCAPGAVPAGQAARVVASTLVSPDPSNPTLAPQPFSFDPVPGGIADPPTRQVDVSLDLEVVAERGPDRVLVEGTIRLRNVP
jgi:prepilin-type N-terminal cleavage/methylation domain-containing protein